MTARKEVQVQLAGGMRCPSPAALEVWTLTPSVVEVQRPAVAQAVPAEEGMGGDGVVDLCECALQGGV